MQTATTMSIRDLFRRPRTSEAAPERRGTAEERQARAWLERQGLVFEAANVTVKGGELDLVMRDADCLVFVEVRQRRSARFGSAVESIDARKRRRLIHAARHYLARQRPTPPARFDVLALQGRQIDWIKNAFEVE